MTTAFFKGWRKVGRSLHSAPLDWIHWVCLSPEGAKHTVNWTIQFRVKTNFRKFDIQDLRSWVCQIVGLLHHQNEVGGVSIPQIAL